MKSKALPVTKNQKLIVQIIDLTHEGFGVAKVDHYTLFIENALPGEKVKVHILKVGKKFGYAKVLKHLITSEFRIDLKNTKILQTGIAPLGHLRYDAQLHFKQQQIQKVLTNIAYLPDVSVLPTIGMEKPYAYRNKAQIPVREINEELQIGFFRRNSHILVPMTDFYIQNQEIDKALLVVREVCSHFKVKAYDEEKHTGYLRHIVIRRGHYTGEMMITLVMREEKLQNKQEIIKALTSQLPEVVSIIQNIHSTRSNVILGAKSRILYGKNTIEDLLLGNHYQISSRSFYQVNTEMAEKLYHIAMQFAEFTRDDIVIDAYCGIGTIGQSIAHAVKHVYGLEVIPEAIADAKENAKKNGLSNVNYEVGDATKILPQLVNEGVRADVLIVDPPRKGLTANFIQAVADTKVRRIVYISCNPATFARDAKLFIELNYQLETVQPVDLFPQTHHIECVGLLTKR